MNLYKTILAAPDDNGRSISTGPTTAVAGIFKAIDTTLSGVHILVKFNSQTPVTFSACIASLTSGVPSIADINDDAFSSTIASANIDLAPVGTGSNTRWVYFAFNATGLSIGTNYAIVIKSNNQSGQTAGVVYREVASDCVEVSSAYIFTSPRNTWSIRQENGVSVAPCIMYRGMAYDNSANPVDLGSTTTSGNSSRRGHPTWVMAYNDSSTPSGRVSLYQTSDGTGSNPETYATETYNAPMQWSRLDPGKIPFTKSSLNTDLIDAYENPSPSIAPGQFVLFYQRDRAYPVPRIFCVVSSTINDETSANGAYINHSTDTSDALDASAVTVYSNMSSHITISNNIDIPRQSTLNNENYFPTNVQVGQYIAKSGNTKPENAFKVIDNTVNSVVVNGRRLHPDPEWRVSLTNPGENKKAYISYWDLSALYANTGSDTNSKGQIPLVPSSRSRFFDATASFSDGAFSWSKLFVIAAHAGNDGASLPDFSPASNLPYLAAHSINGHVSGTGTYVDSPGLCLYSGRATSMSVNQVVPEQNDIEAMTYMGIANRDDDTYTEIPSAQGLVLVQHRNEDFYVSGSAKAKTRSLIDAFVVRNISDGGIFLEGRLVCAAWAVPSYADGTTDADSLTTLTLPQMDMPSLTMTGFHVIIDPFRNPDLSSGNGIYAVNTYSQGSGTTAPNITIKALRASVEALVVPVTGTDKSAFPIYIIKKSTTSGTASTLSGYDHYDPTYSNNDNGEHLDFADGKIVDYQFTSPQYQTGGSYVEYGGSGYSFKTMEAVIFGFVVNDSDITNDKNYFYQDHNLREIHNFIDRLPDSGINVAICCDVAGTQSWKTANPVTNKQVIKDAFTNFFSDVNSGAVRSTASATQYMTIAAKISTESTTISSAATFAIIIGSANSTESASPVVTAGTGFETNVSNAAFVRVSPCSLGSKFAEIASVDETKYGAFTYGNCGNLSDVLMSYAITPLPETPNYGVQDFSLIVPLYHYDHAKVWNDANKRAGETSHISGIAFKPYNGITSNYEILQDPSKEWRSGDTGFVVINPCPGILDAGNIVSNSGFATFPLGGIGTGPSTFAWKFNSNITGSGPDRIFFLYKNIIATNGDLPQSPVTSVDCVVQMADNANFVGATTLFNGTIDNGSTSVAGLNSYQCPDGFNVFALDLESSQANGQPWLRISMAPHDGSYTTHVQVKALKAYASFDGSTTHLSNAPMVFAGTARSLAYSSPNWTATLSGNDYAIFDLGIERYIKSISLTFDSGYKGNGDIISIAYKSFIQDKSGFQPEKTVKTIRVSEEVLGSANKYETDFFGRFVIIKANAGVPVTISAISLEYLTANMAAAYSGTLSESTSWFAKNNQMAYIDEDIRTASRSRVCSMEPVAKVFAANLGGNYINQISFNSILEKKTIFKIEYATSLLASNTVSGWVALGNGYFQATQYERIDGLSMAILSTDGSILSTTGIPTQKSANNGLAGWVVRVVGKQNILLPIVASDNTTMTLSGDITEFGAIDGDSFFIEKPNLYTFPAVNATAVQITRVSGGNCKINSMKFYAPLIDPATGVSVAPTTGSPVTWNIHLNY